jgi:putative ABC transport system permease protein
MKFLPYLFKNMMRNKLRTAFTAASIGVSLFLVTLLYAYLSVQDELAGESAVYNRVVTLHSQGLTFPVPIAHLDRVRSMPDVEAVSQLAWFGGKYKDERVPFAQFATDPQNIMNVMTEYELAPDQLKAWQDDRTGCVVGTKLAAQKGWSIGDKVVLKGDIYPADLELTVRGIYDGPETADLMMLWFNYTYLDELLKKGRSEFAGNAGTLFVKTSSAEAMPRVMQQIDARFANSDAPTRTMTEQAFQQMFTEMLGNVRAYIRNTALAVVFSLVCVAANAMAMSMRERTREVAVLKAIGFSRPLVLRLVLSEAVAIAVIGGLLGVLGAKLLFHYYDLSTLGLPGITRFYIPWSTAAFGLAISAAIGLAAGIVPAWFAARLPVIDGLRRVV